MVLLLECEQQKLKGLRSVQVEVYSNKYQIEKSSIRIQQNSINALTLRSTVYTIACFTIFSMKGLCIYPPIVPKFTGFYDSHKNQG
jgi:hypothetical protein